MKDPDELVDHALRALSDAARGKSPATEAALSVQGPSPRVLHLLANLARIPGGAYLEVGTWMGASWLAAASGNRGRLRACVTVDNRALGGAGALSAFRANAEAVLGGDLPPGFLAVEADAFGPLPAASALAPYDVVFYDGDHSYDGQFRGVAEVARRFLAPVGVLVVDDYNLDAARRGTDDGLRRLGGRVRLDVVLREREPMDRGGWWNGIRLLVLDRR